MNVVALWATGLRRASLPRLRRSPNAERVNNGADIDASPAVFARDMGLAADAPLLNYFRDRSIWRITVDRDRGPFVVERIAAPAAGPPVPEGP